MVRHVFEIVRDIELDNITNGIRPINHKPATLGVANSIYAHMKEWFLPYHIPLSPSYEI